LDYNIDIKKQVKGVFQVSFSLPFFQTKNEKNKNAFMFHPYYIQLVNDLEKTKYAMDITYKNFENAVDPDLIDCYIYEMNAIQKKYKFLLSRVKKMEMSS